MSYLISRWISIGYAVGLDVEAKLESKDARSENVKHGAEYLVTGL